MSKVKVLIRKEMGIGEGAAVGATPSGMQVFMSPVFGEEFDEEKLKEKYGDDLPQSVIDDARRYHKWGNRAKWGLAGLGALNSMYNQTSSGRPGVGGAALSGGFTGYAAGSGLPGMAADLAGRRYQRQQMNSSGDPTTEGASNQQLAEPTGNTMSEDGYTPMDALRADERMNPAMDALREDERERLERGRYDFA